MNTRTKMMVTLATLGLTSALASADIVDFSFADDGVTPLANGQSLEPNSPFGTIFTLSSTGNNQGLAIFDTNSGGINDGGVDDDLIVDLGNALILQSNDSPTQIAGFFLTANDSAQGGAITFDFSVSGLPIMLNSVDLIDIDGGAETIITLVDGQGLARVIIVPDHYTGENAYATIDLTTFLPQQSTINPALFTTNLTVPGFDMTDIQQMIVQFDGSAALDNLDYTVVPAPAGLAMLGLGVLGRRRRRTA